jgi:Holliday junction resolvase
MKYPSSDLVVGNGNRLLVIECKACKSDKEYIDKDQVGQLKELSQRLGAEAWIGIRFDRKDWLFLRPHELKESEKHLIAVKLLAETIGRNLDKLTKDL